MCRYFTRGRSACSEWHRKPGKKCLHFSQLYYSNNVRAFFFFQLDKLERCVLLGFRSDGVFAWLSHTLGHLFDPSKNEKTKAKKKHPNKNIRNTMGLRCGHDITLTDIFSYIILKRAEKDKIQRNNKTPEKIPNNNNNNITTTQKNQIWGRRDAPIRKRKEKKKRYKALLCWPNVFHVQTAAADESPPFSSSSSWRL